MCNKINDIIKSAHKLSYVYCRLARLTRAFKIILIYRSHQKDIKLYVLDPFHLQMANKLLKEQTSMYTVKITQKEHHHLVIWNSETTQNQNIYSHNYQTEATIFLATKHEKTMACSYLNFYKHFLHFKLLASNTTKNEIIHLNSWHHSNRKQKNSLKTLVVLLIFLLELEISGMTLQRIHQKSKKWEFL